MTNAQIHAMLLQRHPGGVLPMLLQGMQFCDQPDGLHISFAHKHFARFYKTHQADMEKLIESCLGSVALIYEAETDFKPQTTPTRDAFEQFLCSQKNLPALAAAREFCKGDMRPRTLVICGEVDSGKSFLLALMEESFRSLGLNVNRVSAGEPGNLGRSGILLVDDLQLLEREQTAQNRLCLEIGARPVAITMSAGYADRFSPRLSHRILAALAVELFLPDLPTKIKFIGQEANKQGLKLNQAQIMALARHAPGFSALLGLLQKIAFYGKLTGRIYEAEELEKMANPANRPQEWDNICSKVAQRMGVRHGEMIGTGRKQDIVRARQAAMYLCRTQLHLSYPEIGRLFGGRDHATVMHAIKKIQQLRTVDKVINILLTELESGA